MQQIIKRKKYKKKTDKHNMTKFKKVKIQFRQNAKRQNINVTK